MREIKFRAWDKTEKRMLEVLSIDWANQRIYFSIREDRFGDKFVESINFHEIVLMQFTGLKALNGKEIYEGDIIKGIFQYANDNGLPVEKKRKKTQVIKWVSTRGMVGFSAFPINFGEFEIEIIGNIHQNRANGAEK